MDAAFHGSVPVRSIWVGGERVWGKTFRRFSVVVDDDYPLFPAGEGESLVKVQPTPELVEVAGGQQLFYVDEWTIVQVDGRGGSRPVNEKIFFIRRVGEDQFGLRVSDSSFRPDGLDYGDMLIIEGSF